MRFEKPVAAVIAALLVAPGPSLAAVPATVSGSVLSAGGAPLAAAELVLVNLDSGRLTSASTDARGGFEARVEPGIYSIVPRGARVVSGPRVLAAQAGQRLQAALVVEAVAPPVTAAAPSLTADHEPVGCFTADEFGQVSAAFQPMSEVAEARVYFKAHWETDYHWVPMVPEVGRHVACLPRPRRDASPVYYYVEAQAKDGALLRLREVDSLVVSGAGECPAERRLAVVCPRLAGLQPPFPGAVGTIPGAALGGGLPALMVVGASAIGVMMVMQRQPNASPSR